MRTANTQLQYAASSERDNDDLDRCRSTPLSSDARPLQFITVIVEVCPQYDSVARVI